jgi:hypothetical protein
MEIKFTGAQSFCWLHAGADDLDAVSLILAQTTEGKVV